MACCFAGRGSPTHLNPLGRQVFDMGSSERDECMNEIRLLQSMDHPHIIDYLSCVIEHNELTVVMELVRASSARASFAPPARVTETLLPAPLPPAAHPHSSPIPRPRPRTATWLGSSRPRRRPGSR